MAELVLKFRSAPGLELELSATSSNSLWSLDSMNLFYEKTKQVSVSARSLISCFNFFLDSSVGKESACNVGAPGVIPGSERSPGEG